MKNPIKFFRNVLRVLASVAAIFYVVFLVDESISIVDALSLEGLTVYLLFLFFMIGYIYVWKNEIVTGLLWVVWYGLQWGLVMYVWTDAALTLVLGFPIPIIGIFFLWHGWQQLKKNKTLQVPKEEEINQPTK